LQSIRIGSSDTSDRNMTNLRVLIIIPILPPYVGGAATYYSNLLKYLSKSVDVTVLTRAFPGEKVFLLQRNLRILRILPPINYRTRYLTYLGDLFIIPVAIMLLRARYRITVAQLHGVTFSLTPIGLKVLQVLRIPTILDVRGPFFGRTIIGKNVNYYVVASKTYANRLALLGVQREKIVVTGTPLEDMPIESLESLVERRTHTRLLYVGGLEAFKGVDKLLGAFKLASKHSECDFSLMLIGEGSMLEKCKKFIKQDEDGAKLVLAGKLPHHQTLNIIRQCDVLVQPSGLEFTRSLLEALYFKKPVIAVRNADIEDVVKDHVNGLLANDGSEQELAKCIVEVCNPSLRLQLSKGFLQPLITWNDVVKKLVHVYQLVAKTK
jgi:glycosyltransferase involved in cell wall biosynthesis